MCLLLAGCDFQSKPTFDAQKNCVETKYVPVGSYTNYCGAKFVCPLLYCEGVAMRSVTALGGSCGYDECPKDGGQ